MHLDVLQEKIDAITKINEAFVLTTPEGDDMKFFALEFLIAEYLPEISTEKLTLNKKLVDEERQKMFLYQIAMTKLKAKYDPLMNIDPETGAIDTQGVIDRAEDALGTDSDVDILKNLETETDDDEETEE
jgi:hypothetical protein